MDFINNLGMAQRLGAAGVIVLLLVLLLVKQRQKGTPKVKAEKTPKAKSARGGRGKTPKAKPARGKKSGGRRGRRGKDVAEEETPQTPTPAMGRMVPRLPSSADQSGDAFASALGPIGDQAPADAGAPINEPGWPTPNADPIAAAPAADAQPVDATQPIDPIAEAPTTDTGWGTDEVLEGFDPATGWSEPAEAAEETKSDWQTEESTDWNAGDASWETVEEQSAEPDWTSGETEEAAASEWASVPEEDTASEWAPVADEDAAEDAMLQWDPVEEPAAPVAEEPAGTDEVVADATYTDWGSSNETPASEQDDAAGYTWSGDETGGGEMPAVEAPAPMPAETAPGEMAVAEHFAPPVDAVAVPPVEMPDPVAEAPLPEPVAVAVPVVEAHAVEQLTYEPQAFDAAPVYEAAAPAPFDTAPVAQEPVAIAPVFDEPVQVTQAPVFDAAPVLAPDPVAQARVFASDPPQAATVPDVAMPSPVFAPEPTAFDLPDAPSVQDEPQVEEVRASQVMAAPVINPLDRWAGLAPTSEVRRPTVNPVEAWARMTPGAAPSRAATVADQAAVVAPQTPVATSTVVAPTTPATPQTGQMPAWWDVPSDVEQNPRRGRFALGGYALKAGHQVVSGVTFREGVVPPPSTWVIGPVDGPVPPGTLVLEVDGCLNCRAEDLAVLMEPGFAPTTDGFSLRLSALEQGPFAASGTYRIA